MSGPHNAGASAPVRVYARIENEKVAELISIQHDPAESFHGSLVWVNITTVSPLPQEGWTYDAQADTFSPPAAREKMKLTRISPLDFMARLTPSETGAIATAAQGNAQIFLWLLQCSAAQEIDLLDPRIQAGLDGLVEAKLITAKRAKAIATP